MQRDDGGDGSGNRIQCLKNIKLIYGFYAFSMVVNSVSLLLHTHTHTHNIHFETQRLNTRTPLKVFFGFCFGKSLLFYLSELMPSNLRVEWATYIYTFSFSTLSRRLVFDSALSPTHRVMMQNLKPAEKL